MEKLQTIKLWNITRKKLRLLSAQLDIPMTKLMDDLVEKEAECQRLLILQEENSEELQ